MAPKLIHILMTALLALALGTAAHAESKAPEARAALVVLGKVEQRAVKPRVVLTGVAQPHRLITVASRVEEIVGRVLVEEGQAVQAGQVLVELDQVRLKLRLAQAGAVQREANARLAQLRRDLARKQSLFDKKSIPLKGLEDARTDLARQRALAESSRESVKLLEFELRHATIKAPAAGVIVARLVNEGEWVKKGGPLLKLSVLNPIKAVVKVPERYLSHLSVGQQVCSTVDATPGKTYCGTIAAIVPSGDPHSHTFPVQIRVDNPDGRIKPGMLMRMRLEVGAERRALLVPKDALVVATSGQSVFVVIDGKAQPVTVKLLGSFGGSVQVSGKLEAGQPVVVVGNERLRPGQPVREKGPAKAKVPPKPASGG